MKKLTAAQKRARKAAKAERQRKYQWVFMNGKLVRIKRPPTIEGMDVDEFIRRNADLIWLHQNDMWEYIDIEENTEYDDLDEKLCQSDETDDDISFSISRIPPIIVQKMITGIKGTFILLLCIRGI